MNYRMPRVFGLASWGVIVISGTFTTIAQDPPLEPTPAVTSSEAQRLVGEVMLEVEALRGLRFERDVEVHVVDAAAARRHMLDRLEQFQAAEHLFDVQRAYATLGLLPEGLDVLELLLDALEQQAGGYYDPAQGAFFLLDDIPAALTPVVSAHELTHALEDQHYGLDARIREVERDDDRLFALGALHEGSANLLMSIYLARRVMDGRSDAAALRALEQSAGPALDGMPAVLLRQLVGPYLLGVEFLARGDLAGVVARGFPVDDVDRAFRRGPSSSEQILHPEKYWDPALRDDPRSVNPVDVGKTLGRRWQRRADGVLGELGAGVLVGAESPLDDPGSTGSGRRWTNAAAAGWGGDRWELWVRGDDAVVLWSSVWDSTRDAREFAAALPRQERLRRRVEADRVAVVAGAVSARKAERLLQRMLVLQ